VEVFAAPLGQVAHSNLRCFYQQETQASNYPAW
jgi:hypothetical protein